MDAPALTAWEGHLAALGQRIAAAVAGLDVARGDAVRPSSVGLGDASWALDETCETVVATWFEERAREGPLSLLTEHHGWRHRGPDGRGGWRELDGFAHGGPRLACDPVDGTRHLLLRHRPAWSLIALADPGPGQPRQRDVLLAHAEELVERAGPRGRSLGARRGEGAWMDCGRGREPLLADTDDRVDHGFVTFFAFHPAQRPAVARLAKPLRRRPPASAPPRGVVRRARDLLDQHVRDRVLLAAALAAEDPPGVQFNLAEAGCSAADRTWRPLVDFFRLATGLISGMPGLTELNPVVALDR